MKLFYENTANWNFFHHFLFHMNIYFSKRVFNMDMMRLLPNETPYVIKWVASLDFPFPNRWTFLLWNLKISRYEQFPFSSLTYLKWSKSLLELDVCWYSSVTHKSDQNIKNWKKWQFVFTCRRVDWNWRI